MTLRIQTILFVIIGIITWGGVDRLVDKAKSDAETELLLRLSLQSLVDMKVSDI